MSLTLEHFSHPEHLLILIDDDIIERNAKCHICNKAVIGYPTYTCTSHHDTDCQNFYLHKSCAIFPKQINHLKHTTHPLTLPPTPDQDCYCDVCGLDSNFAYACADCDFNVCLDCAGVVVQIQHHKHSEHPLTLLPRHDTVCKVCYDDVKWFAYACEFCEFDVCMLCASEQRVVPHEGHNEHPLTLMPRKAYFMCDACGVRAKESSYACTICDFWIHKTCAFSPSVIQAPPYHHHSLYLFYSIPDMHRLFDRYCQICDEEVRRNYWLYYCHKCTYFVHMRCATSSDALSMVNKVEEESDDNECDVIQFPLHSEASLLDLIITRCSELQLHKEESAFDLFKAQFNKLKVYFQDKDIITTDPHILEHCSHRHPLEQLQYTTSEDDSDDSDDDRRALICNGCIQPITISHPCYYACIECGFFLHSFCATRLPRELPAGVSSIHPQHSLLLRNEINNYFMIYNAYCGACKYPTNGFFYQCQSCNVILDIVCAFMPARVKHKSHKHHSLVQRHISEISNFVCIVTDSQYTDGVGYVCEICSTFQISISRLSYPSMIKHKYDDHPITLRFPPFFHEGVIYCEMCEEQINNRRLLYHCDKCDHSFHYNCAYCFHRVKFGGTIKLTINKELHTFALVLKNSRKIKDRPMYICRICGTEFKWNYFLECSGCGFLVTCDCAARSLDLPRLQYS